MAPIHATPLNLDAPWHQDTLLQVRTSKMKPMRNLNITTGIYKQPVTTHVFCTFAGLADDEHDLTFHGGIDKAVHQYFPGHYASWKQEYPEQADEFNVGGFGENLVSEKMNERNVCIGDIIRIGGVLLQVSLPRQPCFKLNHRFGVKNFAGQTWKKSRTGWYYRVLEEGWMEVGDTIVLVERKWSEWTIERVQEYLHRDKTNLEMLTELSKIPEFGNECKKGFAKHIAKIHEDRANALKKKEPETWEEFTLTSKEPQTKRITSFTFSKANNPDGAEGDELDPGCFIRLKLPNGLIRPYSIVSGFTNNFQLGIALEEPSRGGSSFLHNKMKVGDKLLVGKITESVPIPEGTSHHIFIAGGIGITAFLMHVDVYRQIHFDYTFHYAVRDGEELPFQGELEKMGDRLKVYDGEKGERLDIEKVLRERKWNSHVYVCGGKGIIEECKRVEALIGMEKSEIHYEAFGSETSGDPFTVEVKGEEKKVLCVDGEKTLLETLREVGMEVDSSCEVGNCGTCRVKVLRGKVEHRGSGLSEGEKEEGCMLSCVSRGVGHLVIEF